MWWKPCFTPALSLCWIWRVIDELLPIHFFIPSTCPSHYVTDFTDFHWFQQLSRALFTVLLFFKPLLLGNRKKYQETVIGRLPDFAAFPNSAIKKNTFISFGLKCLDPSDYALTCHSFLFLIFHKSWYFFLFQLFLMNLCEENLPCFKMIRACVKMFQMC